MSKKQSSPSSQVRKVKIKKGHELIKKISLQDIKDASIISVQSSFSAESILKKLAKNQSLISPSKERSVNENIFKNMMAISLAFSQESGYALMESIEPEYRGFALLLRTDLQQEFDCKTASEIALVDQAVNSHIRKLSNSKLLEERNEQSTINYEKVALLSFYSKEIERAHRQFISAIETLRFMKQPSLKVSIKTNNAFVGENQQFNNNNRKNENNEPK